MRHRCYVTKRTRLLSFLAKRHMHIDDYPFLEYSIGKLILLVQLKCLRNGHAQIWFALTLAPEELDLPQKNTTEIIQTGTGSKYSEG